MSQKVALTEYFKAVDRRLIREGLMPRSSFRVNICNKLIDLYFPNEPLAESGASCIEAFITDKKGEPDATFLYWYDRCDAYLPKGEGEFSSVWQSADDTGTLKIGTDDDSLVGCDVARQRYYFARPEPATSAYLKSRHIMVNAFARWARYNGMLLLHAAAVGAGGNGVLIAGRGGSGKSTFAVSCLAQGLDFVSDDYTLITADGPLEAKPLYSVVALREDMYKSFPQLGSPMLESDGSFRGGKPQFCVPKERFSESLDIKALVMPVIAFDEEPSISRVSPGKIMTQLIHSTITQIEFRRDTALIQQMLRRLSSLPIYEMRMSTDLAKNPAFLRRFIEKEL